MALPFTHDQFLDVFGAYNARWWPAAAAAWAATSLALTLLATERRAHRFTSAVLASLWAWGALYHFVFFAPINPAARVFGMLFLLEAVLLVWFGVVRRRLTYAWGPAPLQILSVALAAYALIYPLLGLAMGLSWPRLPSFGVPCPTAMLTAGLLLAAPPRAIRVVAVIPLLWAGIGGSAAVLLGITPDYMLVASGVVLLVYVVAPRTLTAQHA